MTRLISLLSATAVIGLAACMPEAPAPEAAAAAPAADCASAACVAGAQVAARLNGMAGTDIGNGVVVQQAVANANLVTLTVQASGDGILSDSAWFAANQGLVQGTVQSTLCAALDYEALLNGGGILPVDVVGSAGQRMGSLTMGRCGFAT